MRKKTVQALDPRQVLLIENAYYQSNPPNKPANVIKIRSPIEIYVRKLIYNDLTKKNVEKVLLKQLRKLNWDDPLHYRAIMKVCPLFIAHNDSPYISVDKIMSKIDLLQSLEAQIFSTTTSCLLGRRAHTISSGIWSGSCRRDLGRHSVRAGD
jgi:hypothetical protein